MKILLVISKITKPHQTLPAIAHITNATSEFLIVSYSKNKMSEKLRIRRSARGCASSTNHPSPPDISVGFGALVRMMAGRGAALLLLGIITRVRAHGAMITPPPRNAIDSTLPGVNWGNGSTRTGVIEPLSVFCSNGTTPCRPGQAVFWFSQGCTPGCDACDGQGQRIPNWNHCNASYTPTLAKKYWTANRNATAGSPQDIWKFQPWRSPGLAPVTDACGMAGGSPTPMYNGAEYTPTKFAKQGDLGSRVLAPRPTGVRWAAGGVANVSWYLAFNHGGGYKYRLCPRAEPLTEACFQRAEHQLEFASDSHLVLLPDGPRQIPNTVVKEGGGVGWMMNPIPMPNFIGSDCDDMSGHPCGGCPCGSGYPGGNTHADFPNPFGKDLMGRNAAIVDLVRVPRLPPGEYVLGFRWDCETSSQVWSTCADISIV